MPGVVNGKPLQYSCQDNATDRGDWWATVHGVAKSQTKLSDFTSLHFLIVYIDWASQVAPVVKNLPANAGEVRDKGLIPGLGRSPAGGHGNLLQYSCLGNPRDRGAWWATVQRVAKSQTRVKQFSMHAHTYIHRLALYSEKKLF